MKIICPDCQKENKIIVKGGTNCRHCQKPLDDYKFIKPLVPALLLIAMGVGGTHAVQHFTDQHRYPTKIEYALIDQCLTSDSSAVKFTTFKKKRDVCISALEATQEEFTYSEFKEDQQRFVLNFWGHARASSF